MFGTEFVGSAHVIAPAETYLPTVGKFLTCMSELPADAIGDPAGVADAVLAVVAMSEPPLRLAVGAEAISGIRTSLESRLAELATTV